VTTVSLRVPLSRRPPPLGTATPIALVGLSRPEASRRCRERPDPSRHGPVIAPSTSPSRLPAAVTAAIIQRTWQRTVGKTP